MSPCFNTPDSNDEFVSKPPQKPNDELLIRIRTVGAQGGTRTRIGETQISL